MSKMVRDLMEHKVVMCKPETMLLEAAKMMSEQNVSCLIVIDEMDEACGIVTGMDLLRNCAENPRAITVEDIMLSPAPTISPTAPVARAISMMLEKEIQHLVIVHGVPSQPMKPVGLISVENIIKGMAEEEEV